MDLTDQRGMTQLLDQERPQEICSFAAMMSVAQSWPHPVEVARMNGVAVLEPLEAVRSLRASGYAPRSCQASSAETFGTPQHLPQDERHPIRPSNLYATAKAFANFSAINHREAHDALVSTLIPFNREGPLRPPRVRDPEGHLVGRRDPGGPGMPAHPHRARRVVPERGTDVIDLGQHMDHPDREACE